MRLPTCCASPGATYFWSNALPVFLVALTSRRSTCVANYSRVSEPERLVSVSEASRRILSLIDLVAGHDTTVLLRGESGTGKEVFARRIHRRCQLARTDRFCASTVVRCRRACWRARCSDTSAARSPDDDAAPRAVRAGAWRHAAFGRSGRASATGPGQAAARPAGGRDRARRWREYLQRRCASDRCHASAAGADDRSWDVSIGPVLTA